MQIHELNPYECTEVLSRTHLGRLACCRFDQPYVVPIYFSYDTDRKCIYAFSMVGQKVDWMRENPKVCLEVEEVTDKNEWTTVLVFGRYEELARTASHAEARRRAERLFQKRLEWWLPAAAQVKSQQHEHVVVYSIAIDRMTGRRAGERIPNP